MKLQKLEKTENKEDTKNLKIWNRYSKSYKYRTICNDKNVFISTPGYAYIVEISTRVMLI